MKFIFGGEGFWGWLDRATYTLSFILAVLIIGAICILAAIGLIALIGFLFSRPKKSKMSSNEKWLKTGKW